MQVFSVEGMTCGHCVKSVTQAVHNQDPSAEVKVDLAAKQVSVQSQLSAQQIADAIREEGYSVV
ncbi:heavy-metal-associated domain-containing protein [Pseudomonas sp. PDM05]|jgi:copper chaperone|uniref:heavy-metal-associated domain-containing protein n=1 Tax=unclassified Pseudomonas TaxID=196821 RepID=UPI00177BF59E|nr:MULTISPECIES: cation transporter [unclassified Pseudomonas]MBD9460202.1 heavy-metal-associated domain-containing protein [Pseudomonas sp. PDM05]WLH80022.1 cation transporter [Pseudomonas sp. FP2335]